MVVPRAAPPPDPPPSALRPSERVDEIVAARLFATLAGHAGVRHLRAGRLTPTPS